jgi:hypothetical protein
MGMAVAPGELMALPVLIAAVDMGPHTARVLYHAAGSARLSPGEDPARISSEPLLLMTVAKSRLTDHQAGRRESIT